MKDERRHSTNLHLAFVAKIGLRDAGSIDPLQARLEAVYHAALVEYGYWILDTGC
jgi:hypothetical protein